MVSPVLNEGWYSGGFLMSEGNGQISRSPGLIDNATGADIQYSAGLVVVQNNTGSATAAAHAGNTGNGTMSAVTVAATAFFGAYLVTFTSSTAFTVTDPNGNVVGTGTTGTAFSDEIGFTITAGGVAFAAGDYFTVTVSEQNGAWVSWTGGSITTPIGILFDRVYVEAGMSAEVVIIQREAEVQTSALQWDPAVLGAGNVATLQAQALAALATSNVIAR